MIKIQSVATVTLYRKVSTYKELKRAVKDYSSETRAFRSEGLHSQKKAGEWLKKQSARDLKPLARSDARVKKFGV